MKHNFQLVRCFPCVQLSDFKFETGNVQKIVRTNLIEVSTKKCEKLLEIHDFWVILVVETSLATVLAMSRSLFWTLWIVWILTNFYWFFKKI